MQLYCECWICEVLVGLFLWKRSSRRILSSAVTFAAVILWFLDTVLHVGHPFHLVMVFGYFYS